MWGDMLKLAVAVSGKPPKAVARENGYSEDALYAAMGGNRHIPTMAREKLARLNVFGCMAVAGEATGLGKIFGYLRVDRHIQTLLQLVFKEDREADESIGRLPQVLLNKTCREDLEPGDEELLIKAGKEICDRIRTDFNFIAELDAKYELDLMRYLGEKEKADCVAARPVR